MASPANHPPIPRAAPRHALPRAGLLPLAVLAAAALALIVLGACAAGSPRPGDIAAVPEPAAHAGMVPVPAGTYQPPFRPALGGAGGIPQDRAQPVPAFRLDAYPVTNAEFLAFLRAVPHWQRSRVPPVLADNAYLARWADDLRPGPRAPQRAPVVDVSWFAAAAYCEWRGKQLPSTAQWEYAAGASEAAPDGRSDPGFAARILAWYARPNPDVLPPVGSAFTNVWGVHDLHGLVWEWTENFAVNVDARGAGPGSDSRGLFCGAGSIGAVDSGDYATFMRFAFRSSLRSNYTAGSLGFRCAQAAPGAAQ